MGFTIVGIIQIVGGILGFLLPNEEDPDSLGTEDCNEDGTRKRPIHPDAPPPPHLLPQTQQDSNNRPGDPRNPFPPGGGGGSGGGGYGYPPPPGYPNGNGYGDCGSTNMPPIDPYGKSPNSLGRRNCNKTGNKKKKPCSHPPPTSQCTGSASAPFIRPYDSSARYSISSNTGRKSESTLEPGNTYRCCCQICKAAGCFPECPGCVPGELAGHSNP